MTVARCILMLLREQAGLDREGLAAAAGVTVEQIANMEQNGEVTTQELVSVAGALGVQVDKLFVTDDSLILARQLCKLSDKNPRVAALVTALLGVSFSDL